MQDYMNLAGAPYDEECVQVQTGKDYEPEMRKECKRFMRALERYYALVQPDGAWFRVTSNPHDFGTYYEVACMYNDDWTDTELFALYCESETPGTWDALENGAPLDKETYQKWCDTKLADMVGDTDDWDDETNDQPSDKSDTDGAVCEAPHSDVRSAHPNQVTLW